MAIMGLAKLFRYHTDETLEIIIVKSETYADESIDDIGIDRIVDARRNIKRLCPFPRQKQRCIDERRRAEARVFVIVESKDLGRNAPIVVEEQYVAPQAACVFKNPETPDKPTPSTGILRTKLNAIVVRRYRFIRRARRRRFGEYALRLRRAMRIHHEPQIIVFIGIRFELDSEIDAERVGSHEIIAA